MNDLSMVSKACSTYFVLVRPKAGDQHIGFVYNRPNVLIAIAVNFVKLLQGVCSVLYLLELYYQN